jgi:hypothetical protein
MRLAFSIAAVVLLAVPLEGQQEPAELALFKKCDSQIPWLTDGAEIADGTPKPPIDPGIDRPRLLEIAKTHAREQDRLILWYCMRLPGTHTYRAAILDTYMRVALFTDPGLVDLISGSFVPLRMACDEKTSAATGIRFPEVIEPALVVLTPEGRIVHTLDRIRTFNADWVRAVLLAVLRKHAPEGSFRDDAVPATPDQKAVTFRRAGRFREVLDLSCAPMHKGIALLGLREFEKARAILEKEESAEGLYHLSAVEWWTGKDPEKTWRKLVEKHPNSPWAWKAAANLVTGRDSLRHGPMAHNFEDFFLQMPEGTPTTTRLAGKDVDATASRAMEFLLRAQRADGSWSDSRYSYGWAAYMIRNRTRDGLLAPGYSSWPDTGHHPNVFVAMTALAARALLEWRDAAPGRIDEAVARAEQYLRNDDRVLPAQCEACYAETYRLLFFEGRKDITQMNRIIHRLADLQDRDGFWGHEYPSAFATAAVMRCLVLAKRAGADVSDSLLQRAADALLKTRGTDGHQAYRHEPGKGPGSERNALGRTASSELALHECGRGSLSDVAAGVDVYWKHLARLEAVRTCDNHADEELAGFFYFNSVFHTLEAARELPEPLRAGHLAKFRSQVLAIPEWDGSFIDSHELGKSYGTAMALLILRRVR